MSVLDRGASSGAPPHPVVRSIWAERLGDEVAADRFLAATLGTMPSPLELPQLAEAADRIEIAIASGERLAVFGHDDPDGITSAVILTEALEALGGDVETYIPDRHVEGHGLYPALIDRFHAHGADLLVTTDGCSGNHAEVEQAARLGIDVIITDHHEIADGRPRPPFLVNPKADRAVAARLGELTGAGVAALLVHEILGRASRPDLFLRALDLAALGTVADWASLGGPNRAMVAAGLADVIEGRRPAVAEAVRALGFDSGAVLRPPDCRKLAAVFASIPSEEGRSIGFDALIGRPGGEARVETLLARWREDEAEVCRTADRAEEQAAAAGVLDGAPAVLLMEDVPHRGLGRAATRLVELTGRPAAVLLRRKDDFVAELRGPEGVHLVDVLAGMRELLGSWGGHRVAAGFSAGVDRVEEIRDRLAAALAREKPAPPTSFEPDVALGPESLDTAFIASLRAAAPFGKGNPAPVFRVVRPESVAAGVDGEDLARAMQETAGCGILLTGSLPEGSAGRDPLLSFEPSGARWMTPHFLGWTTSEPRLED